MKQPELEKQVEVTEGVQVEYKNRVFVAKGKAGEVQKEISYPTVTIDVSGNIVSIKAKNATKREKMQIGTMTAHIRNLIKGAAEGFTYELKICSGHFPMSASVKGETFELKNFLGENTARTLKLKQGAKVTVDGDKITVEAPSKELAGQVAADLESVTRITNKDRRIFQDGIYITKKAGKQM